MKKQFRFINHAGDVGTWRDYNLADFLADCEAWAENGAKFAAEFRNVPID